MPTTINGLVKIRKGTASAMASVVLLDGEIGFATDTGEIKVGDGVTVFSGLSAGYYTKANTYTKTDLYTKTQLNNGTDGALASTSQYGVVKKTITIGSTTTDPEVYYNKQIVDSTTNTLIQNILNSFYGKVPAGSLSIQNPFTGTTYVGP